ncbi:MAG TPA: UDP-N-acetylmuramate dehydrogenase [Pyrinomonadaceae bacterium]|jgi:UDP-N-acetylmuramate dehydrogenase|nr:UDP-N-acetylmuramate dehydrogenase [Pyrinomonadaceae bacterium]
MTPIQIQEHISLAPLTTLNIGGEARFFARAENEEQILAGLEFARQRALPVFILGGGSNVLIADDGFDGLVLQMVLGGIAFEESRVTAAGGEGWDDLVRVCVEKNLAGVECLSGIPGFVGATPIQNVGAYGQDVSETITAVRVYDRETARFETMSNADCGFSYRSSIFNSTQKDRYIVTAVTYDLALNGEPSIRYADLKKYFAGKNEVPSLSDVRQAVIEIRAKKSMVISPGDPNSRSAGSFFKNPVVSLEKFDEIQEAAKTLGLTTEGQSVPFFAAGDGEVKVPAAWLIEKSGFQKGYVFGNVGLSENHTLAIINRGNAKAGEVLGLMNAIQAAVRENFGVELKPEPIFIGF